MCERLSTRRTIRSKRRHKSRQKWSDLDWRKIEAARITTRVREGLRQDGWEYLQNVRFWLACMLRVLPPLRFSTWHCNIFVLKQLWKIFFCQKVNVPDKTIHGSVEGCPRVLFLHNDLTCRLNVWAMSWASVGPLIKMLHKIKCS